MKTNNLILIALFGLFLSCEKSVSKADLEGLWFLALDDRNNDDISFLIFENDSIQLIYENNVIKKGTYNVVNNQLFGYFGVDTFSSVIDEFTKNSFYFLGKSYYHDLDKNDLIYFKNIEYYEMKFIDLKTVKTDMSDKFWHYSFYLDKNTADSIKLHEQFLNFENFISLQGTRQNIALDLRIFVSEGSKIKDYKKLMYHLKNALYGDTITTYFVTKQLNFNKFYYFNDDFIYWENDFYTWQEKQSLPSPPPPTFEQMRAFYDDDPNIIINSPKDLAKLNKIKAGQKVLISYAADLDIKTYIQAQMILKPLYKTGKIRTEILGEVE